MSSILRRTRSPRSLLAVLTVLALLGTTACGGVDLSKQNFQRTTVPVRPAGGQATAPAGPIDDPAVSLRSLRSVAPCGLLGGKVLGQLGKPATPEPQGWSQCHSDITDPGGKTISVLLTIGKNLAVDAEEATGGVGGLPLLVSKQDDKTCFVTAMTSKKPAIGITAQIGYEGGRPCDAGKEVIGGVVNRLHASPPKLTKVPGSLARVAPCSVVDGALVAEVIGDGAKAVPIGLHVCQWRGEKPTLRVGYRIGYQPDDSGGQKVDLGRGVTGYTERVIDTSSTCTVSWMHLPTGDRTGEIVTVDYDNYAAKPEADKPCEKVVKVAKNIVTQLPRP